MMTQLFGHKKLNVYQQGLRFALIRSALLLAVLSGSAVAAPDAAFTGPRIEATASRWTWPSRLAFVNDAMRCTFAGTNENTQLQSIELRAPHGRWVPLTGRAGPLLERHSAAVEAFQRLSDGFLMERQLPAAALQNVCGTLLRTGARLRLAGNEPRLIMEEAIRFLRVGPISAECFALDVTLCQPTTLLWQHGEATGTTNRLEDGVVRVPAEALAVCGSNGVVVLHLTVPADHTATPAASEVLIRHDQHGTRCSFVVTENVSQPDQTVRVQLDLRLLPAGTALGDVRHTLTEVRP